MISFYLDKKRVGLRVSGPPNHGVTVLVPGHPDRGVMVLAGGQGRTSLKELLTMKDLAGKGLFKINY